jgi:aldose 1-epimerase
MIDTIHLQAPGDGGLRAAFAPGANMVLHSLTLGARELLATRDGVQAYAERGSTMGVPLLHPWANRLAGFKYAAAGKDVVLDRGSALFKLDGGGLPIHGALPAHMRWQVLDATTVGDAAMLSAQLDWDRQHPAFALFPFPHRLDYRARLVARRLEIAVALEPIDDAAVPVSFGFHPYLRIPGERATAQVTLPVRRALRHDATMIPTGETEPCEPGLRQLGNTGWDDGFCELANPPRFIVGNHESEVSVTFLCGYEFAQVFAPPGSDFVCFEPMTAPANALVDGADLPVVAPGGRYEAAFEIAVAGAARR